MKHNKEQEKSKCCKEWSLVGELGKIGLNKAQALHTQWLVKNLLKEQRGEFIKMVKGKIEFNKKIINNGQYTLYDWRVARDIVKILDDILTKLKKE